MKKIASFTINHDSLTRGMYVSRVDGDVVTYDIRMKTPFVWCRRPFPMCCSSREKFRAANGGNVAIILPTTWQVQKKLHRKFSRF